MKFTQYNATIGEDALYFAHYGEVEGCTPEELAKIEAYFNQYPCAVVSTDAQEGYFGKCEATNTYGLVYDVVISVQTEEEEA